jgi:predicted ATPase
VPRRVSSLRFVGRAGERGALESALARASEGVPAFTFVAGESGVGKSRLVTEFEAHAAGAGVRVLVGHCLEIGGTVDPYAPLVEALRSIGESLPEATSCSRRCSRCSTGSARSRS